MGKGPTKNPLFQSRLAGLENASVQRILGKPETLVTELLKMLWALRSAGKLNSIQTEILGHNLLAVLTNIIKPSPITGITDGKRHAYSFRNQNRCA